MVRLSALILLIALTLSGAAFCADPPADPNAQPAVVTPAEPTPPPPPAPEPVVVTEKAEKQVTGTNLMVGIYNPVTSETRHLFGDNWLRLGLKTLPVNHLPQWRPTFDINYYAMSKRFLGPPDLRNKATLIPLTAGLTRGFGNQEKRWLYVSFGTGPYYADVSAPTIGVSKKGFGWNANAIAGIHLSNRWTIEARYEYFTKFANQQFDAFVISLAYKIKENKQK